MFTIEELLFSALRETTGLDLHWTCAHERNLCGSQANHSSNMDNPSPQRTWKTVGVSITRKKAASCRNDVKKGRCRLNACLAWDPEARLHHSRRASGIHKKLTWWSIESESLPKRQTLKLRDHSDLISRKSLKDALRSTQWGYIEWSTTIMLRQNISTSKHSIYTMIDIPISEIQTYNFY